VRTVAVVIPLPSGPVWIERLTPEAGLPRSVACLGRSTAEAGAISAAYEDFVRLGTGVIARDFGGGAPDMAFRLDLSGPVAGGRSWTLAVYLAHAVTAHPDTRLAGPTESADLAIWATGEVRHDLSIAPVRHVGDKLFASANWCDEMAQRGIPVVMLCADDPSGERTEPAVHRVRDVQAALRLCGLTPETATAPAPGSPVGRRLVVGGLAVALLGGGLGWALMPGNGTVPDRDPGAAVRAPDVQGDAPAPATETPPETAVALPQKPPTLTILERFPAPGHTCAEVQFSGAEDVLVPSGETPPGGAPCGLAIRLDPGDAPVTAALRLEMISGRVLRAEGAAPLPAAPVEIREPTTWRLDLPRRNEERLEMAVTAILTGAGTDAPVSVRATHAIEAP